MLRFILRMFNLRSIYQGLIMKKIHYSFFIVLLSALISSAALAEHHEAKAGLQFAPVEIYACNFQKGKKQADLDKVIAGWNAWMDESKAEPYSAWIYTAYYNSPGYDFDVAWLGAWPDGKTMGKATDQWLTNGGAQAAEFAKVVDCAVHSNFASTQLRAGISENSDSAVLGFSDCKFAKDAKFPEAMAAAGKWNAYMKEQGSVGSEWIFFPVYGSDPDWHFKLVNAHPNYAELGADYDRYGNGGGFMKAQEILGAAYDCGPRRIYNSKRVRSGLPQQ